MLLQRCNLIAILRNLNLTLHSLGILLSFDKNVNNFRFIKFVHTFCFYKKLKIVTSASVSYFCLLF